MEALIQREVVKKPIAPYGEDINGRMESVTITIKILGIIVYKEIMKLS